MDEVERLLASLHHCAAGRAGLLTARPHPSWQPRLSPSGVCPLRASPGSVCVCVWGTAPWGWISSGRRRAGGCGLQQPPPPGQSVPQNIRKKGFIKHSLAVCPPVLYPAGAATDNGEGDGGGPLEDSRRRGASRSVARAAAPEAEMSALAGARGFPGCAQGGGDRGPRGCRRRHGGRYGRDSRAGDEGERRGKTRRTVRGMPAVVVGGLARAVGESTGGLARAGGVGLGPEGGGRLWWGVDSGREGKGAWGGLGLGCEG